MIIVQTEKIIPNKQQIHKQTNKKVDCVSIKKFALFLDFSKLMNAFLQLKRNIGTAKNKEQININSIDNGFTGALKIKIKGTDVYKNHAPANIEPGFSKVPTCDFASRTIERSPNEIIIENIFIKMSSI